MMMIIIIIIIIIIVIITVYVMSCICGKKDAFSIHCSLFEPLSFVFKM